jgi:tRNA (guanine26-N2/guanine27-N2)-dimethyltransferase
MLDTALDEMIVNCEAMDFRNVPTKGKNGEKDIIPKTPPEAIDHHPFFFTPSALCKVVKARAPAEALIKGAIRHAGYRATRSHCKPGSIKTDAPWEIIWEIIREWVRQRAPIKEGALLDIHPGWKILQATRTVAPVPLESNSDAATIAQDVDTTDDVEMKGNDPVEAEAATATEETNQSRSASSLDPKRLEVVFDEKLGQDKPGKRLVRYQENPRENWGPMRRAQGSRS